MRKATMFLLGLFISIINVQVSVGVQNYEKGADKISITNKQINPGDLHKRQRSKQGELLVENYEHSNQSEVIDKSDPIEQTRLAEEAKIAIERKRNAKLLSNEGGQAKTITKTGFLTVNDKSKEDISYIAPPPDPDIILQGGDLCASATVVSSLPYNSTGTTVGYTDDYDEVCPYDGSTSPDVVYWYSPTANITVDITLCNGTAYDSKLYVYETTCVTPAIACNDDACGLVSELLGVSLTGGNTYYIVIDGYGGSAGTYVLDITEAGAPPANDECVNAEAITGPYPASGYGTCLGATLDCPEFLDWNAVWYTIELPYSDNDVIITICGETEDLYNVGNILMDDCACDDYILADDFTWLTSEECPSGFVGIELIWNNIPGSGIIYWPALAENSYFTGMDFSYTVNAVPGSLATTGACCYDDTCEDLTEEECGAHTGARWVQGSVVMILIVSLKLNMVQFQVSSEMIITSRSRMCM